MIKEKRCSRCEEVKLLTSFHKQSSSKDGKRPDCKECCKKYREDKNKEDVIRYKANILGKGIMNRVKYEINNPKNRCYKDNNVKCTLGNTPKEVSDYLYINHYNEIKSLLENGLTPSVDRISSQGDYSKDNIRIIDLLENTADGVANAIKKTSRLIISSKDDLIVSYDSISEASRILGIKRDTIYAHLDKGTKTRSGYKFNTI